jgi:hypothetical protein
MPQSPYLSTDPHAGAPVASAAGGYLSTDPNAGHPTAPPATAAAPANSTSAPDPNAYAAGRVALGALADHFSPAMVETIGNNVIGVMKGAGHTAVGLGDLFRHIPGLRQLSDAAAGGNADASFAAADEALKPEGTAQKIGHGVEQAAEFLIPAGAAERGAATIAAKTAPLFRNAPRLVRAAVKVAPRALTEALSSGSVAAAQGHDPTAAVAIGAATPMLGAAVDAAATAASPALRSAAESQVMQALGPTKERFKAMAERIVPEMLKRGIRGSREQLAERAGAAVDAAGQEIDAALQQFGSRQVGVKPVSDAIEKAKDAFRATNAVGTVVEFEPRAIRQLDKLKGVIDDLGPDARVDQLVAVRRAWDKVVADAGGYAHRAPGGIGVPLKDISEASTKREATTAIRQLLDTEVPELSALNKEYSFWKNLDDVVTQTMQRKAPHGESIGSIVKESAGQAVGSMASGGNLGAAFALGKLAKTASAVFTSPRWKLASAQAKDALATAIVANNPAQIAGSLSRIMAGATTQATAGR